MYAIAFYYTYHTGLVEFMFDDKETAEKVLEEFESKKRAYEMVINIRSKYGTALLSLSEFCAAVMSNLEESEELAIVLGARRGKIEYKTKEVLDAWARTRQNLVSGGQVHPANPQRRPKNMN